MRRRLPSPATAQTVIPTLASLLAGAALVEGCAHVECGEQRADEVRAHGPRGTEALRRGELRQGLREVAVAAGLVAHGPATVPETTPAGAPVPVTPQPPPPPEVMAPGQMAVVTPQPPPPTQPDPTPPPRVDPPQRHPRRDPVAHPDPGGVTAGAPMPVTPAPPAPPPRGAMRGDFKSVGPAPIGER